MKHKVRISVSDTPQTGGIITCRNIAIRDRILRLLLGNRQKVMVLVPGESAGEITICEVEKGEDVKISAFMFEIHERDGILEEFDEKLWLTTIDQVLVHHDGRMIFKFKNGTELTR